jgi:hypothetical protein
MILRQWYPQLDIYDTIRRMAVLLKDFEKAPGVERLCIADFFLATPAFLHRTSMTKEVRAKFSQLDIARPDKSYVTLPTLQLLFYKMEPVQKQALTELCGRGLIDMALFNQGKVTLSLSGREIFESRDLYTSVESAISSFLTKKLLAVDMMANMELRTRTGLQRML